MEKLNSRIVNLEKVQGWFVFLKYVKIHLNIVQIHDILSYSYKNFYKNSTCISFPYYYYILFAYTSMIGYIIIYIWVGNNLS